MVRKLFSLLALTLLISSCGNSGKKGVSASEEGAALTNKVEFAALIENPGDFIGKIISVEGKVVHVCTQSGKKLFITGVNPDITLYIQAGEDMPKFPMDLLGSEVVVEGTLSQIPAMGAGMGEGMHSGEGMKSGEAATGIPGADTCATSKALASQPVLSDLMMVYNRHVLVR